MQREYREIQMFRIGRSGNNPPNTSGIQNGSSFNDIWDVIDDYHRAELIGNVSGRMRVQVVQHQVCPNYYGPATGLSGERIYYTPKQGPSPNLTFGDGEVLNSGVNLIPRKIDNYYPIKNSSGEFEIALCMNDAGNILSEVNFNRDENFGHLLASDDASGYPLLDVSGSIDASPKTTNFTIIFWRNDLAVYSGDESNPNYYDINASGGYYDAEFDESRDEIGRIEIEVRVEHTGTGTLYTEINSTASLAKEEKITIISTIDGNGRDYWKECYWSCGNPFYTEDGLKTTDVSGSIRRSELTSDANFGKFFFNIKSENVCTKSVDVQGQGPKLFTDLYTFGGYTDRVSGNPSTFWGTDEGNIEIKEIRVTINPGGRINWMPANCTFKFSHVDTDTDGNSWSNHNDTQTGLIWTAGGVNGSAGSEENEIRNATLGNSSGEWKFELSIHGKDIVLSPENKVNLFNQPNGDLIVPIAIEFDVYDYALVDLDGMDAVEDDDPNDTNSLADDGEPDNPPTRNMKRNPGPQPIVTTRNLPQISSFATNTFTTVRLVEDPEPEPEPVDHFTFRNGFLLGVLAVLLLRLLMYVLRARYLNRSK